MSDNAARRILSSSSNSETEGLKYTIYINLFIFTILLTTFELIRNIKQMFLKRITKKFVKSFRVPSAPPRYPLGWIKHIMDISETEFLYMVGLDGYIFLRFIRICFKYIFFFILFLFQF